MHTDNISLNVKNDLTKAITATPEQSKRFFDTRPVGYAAHDQFLGVSVPHIRIIAKTYADLTFEQLKTVIVSPYNEERLLALLILVARYKKGSDDLKQECYDFYMSHKTYVNNWNLVDSSAHYILGAHVYNKDTNILIQLAHSDSLWDRRIAIVATWYFIRNNRFEMTCTIAQILLHDTHDLIHKATGWMLREMGKKDVNSLCTFLDNHALLMPRTMLRYAVEKLSLEQKQYYGKKAD